MAKFDRVNKDKLTPQHPQYDMFEQVKAYTFKCESYSLINNRYQIFFKSTPMFDLRCSHVFIEHLIEMLNGAYNHGRSDMKLDNSVQK